MGHILLLLECGTIILPSNLQPMEYISVHTTASYMRQTIKKDSVLETTQTQPNMTFLQNILQCYLSGETRFILLLVMTKIFPKDCDTHNSIIRKHYPSVYEALYSLISSNRPNNLTHPTDPISTPPTQLKVGYTLSKYFHRYKDDPELKSYLNNDSATLDDTD